MSDGARPARLPRSFHLLWTTTAISNVGDGLRLTALPLLATARAWRSRLAFTELLTNGLIGPPLGGWLFGVAVAVPFGVDGASFAAAAVTMLLLLSGSFAPATRPIVGEPMKQQIIEAFRWFWRRRTLRNLALISAALGTASFIGEAVFVLFATTTLRSRQQAMDCCSYSPPLEVAQDRWWHPS